MNANPADLLTTPETHRSIFFNTLMNFAGVACSAIAALICFPVYIHLLGMEAVGLIGFYHSLQTVLRILDLGLTPTVIREMARSSATSLQLAELPDIARTFEIVFAAAASIIALVVCLASSWIADDWLHNNNIPSGTIATCVIVMGLLCGINWLSMFYQNSLIGLEHQVAYNVIKILEITCGSFGAILLLVFYDLRVELVFYWQLLIGTLALTAYAVALRRALPGLSRKAAFHFDFIRRSWPFASGVAGITALGLVLSHMDKVLLSRYLSLEAFGDYSLAFLIVSSLFAVLVTPLFNVMLPRFSYLIMKRDMQLLQELFHLTVQTVAALTFPLVVVLYVFAEYFVEFWTGDARLAAKVSSLIALLAVGMMLNSLMIPGYLLQLAHGCTSLGATICAILVAVFGPTLFFMVVHFGAEGGAANFAAMNAGYLALGVPLTYARLLPGRSRATFIGDLMPALIVAAVAFFAMEYLLSWSPSGIVWRVGLGATCGIAVTILSALASPRIRRELLGKTRYLATLLKD